MPDALSATVAGSTFFAPKSLARREGRQARTLQIIRTTSPAQIAAQLHRAARVAAGFARDRTLPVERREAEAKIAVACLSGILDVISWPKRPGGGGSGRAPRAIDLATILEAHPSEEPCTVDPVTEPSKPAESGPSVASDELPPKQ